MSEKLFPVQQKRRSFLGRLGVGLTGFAAAAVNPSRVQAQSSEINRWEPMRHEKDDWLDQPARHRLVFDTTTPEGLGEAILYAGNFIRVNETGYSLRSNDLAVVIVVRARSTPFGYNDAMWAKYGMPLALTAEFTDPKTKQAPKVNLYNATGYGTQLRNRGATLNSLFQQGVQLAVCQVATRGYAGAVAAAIGGNRDDIYNELVANLVNSNCRIVPAGIVAVNRAQERGYSLVTT